MGRQRVAAADTTRARPRDVSLKSGEGLVMVSDGGYAITPVERQMLLGGPLGAVLVLGGDGLAGGSDHLLRLRPGQQERRP
jgi:hypothetical protein